MDIFNPTTGEILKIPSPDLSGYVPYTGATSDVNIGTHFIHAQGGMRAFDNDWYGENYFFKPSSVSGFPVWESSLESGGLLGISCKRLYLYNGIDNYLQIYSSTDGATQDSINFYNMSGRTLYFSFDGVFSLQNFSGDALNVNGTSTFTNRITLGYGYAGNAPLRIPTNDYGIPTAFGNGDVWLNNGSLFYQHGNTSGGTMYPRAISTVLFAQTATVTVANTVTETTLVGAGNGNKTLYAPPYIGRTIEIEAEGTITNTGTPTLQIKFKIGTVIVVDTTAVTMATLSGTCYWKARARITSRSYSYPNYAVMGQGDITYANGTTPVINADNNTTTSNISILSTNTIDVTAQWGTANVSNSISCTNLIIKYI